MCIATERTPVGCETHFKHFLLLLKALKNFRPGDIKDTFALLSDPMIINGDLI